MSFTLLDGGLGQELMARSSAKPSPLWSAQTMLESPELVLAVHADYFAAGADVVTTNSYILHRDRLQTHDAGEKFSELNTLACELALRARDAHGNGLVAGGMGPTGRSYRPDLALDVEQGAEVYAEIATLQAPFVDVFLLETMSSVRQATGAAMGAKTRNKPVWLAVSVDDVDGTKLRSGEPVTDLISVVEQLGLDALLINCSTPEAVSTALATLRQTKSEQKGNQDVQIGAYANGFTKISDAFKQAGATVANLEARTDLDPSAYADFAQTWHNDGATIIGGCCEVGPAHIAELARRFK